MTYALLAWLLLLAALVVVYRRHLAACWREPMLRVPVLILESDDWGAGPAAQAPALERLTQILAGVRDITGRPAMMTLGVVLAVIDRGAWRARQTYQARTLEAQEQAGTLEAMRRGIAAGVFAPQLHGMEHYWPAALLRRAATDENVRRWLESDEAPTELLPDALQSRWVDASTLPARALPAAEIETAVAAEARLFASLFGAPPSVAVPNTFVWNDDVERAWATQGVRYVVTPGTRYETRGANGELVSDGRSIATGDIASNGLRYLVRDVYFEPARGHVPERLLNDLAGRTRLGRPCLVETHRFNYLGTGAEESFRALRSGLERAQHAFPEVRFMSAGELGDALASRDPALVETRLAARVARWVRRALSPSRFGKLARLSGLALILRGIELFAEVVWSRSASHSLPLDGGGLGRG